MTHEERSLIKNLEKCDFGEIHAMHVAKVEARRNMSKEEKLVYFHSFSHEMHDVSLLSFCRKSLCVIALWSFALQVLKEANEKIRDEYGFCLLDHHKERIGNFKIEPPGLFRGRGEHPKQGMLKKRIQPEDVIINCGK